MKNITEGMVFQNSQDSEARWTVVQAHELVIYLLNHKTGKLDTYPKLTIRNYVESGTWIVVERRIVLLREKFDALMKGNPIFEADPGESFDNVWLWVKHFLESDEGFDEVIDLVVSRHGREELLP